MSPTPIERFLALPTTDKRVGYVLLRHYSDGWWVAMIYTGIPGPGDNVGFGNSPVSMEEAITNAVNGYEGGQKS